MILNLAQSVEILQKGGVVCFPTETVYGLGAVATNAKSVNRIYQIKNRPRDNPLICHFYSLEQIQQYAKKISNLTQILIDHFSPGPLSFVIDIDDNSPLLPATCGLNSMVARIPNQFLTLKLIEAINAPIVGPSANTSGKFSGTDAEMIQADLSNKIDGILDGGQCQIGLESTIIDARDNSYIKILRQGAIGQRELQEFLQTTKKFQNTVVLDQNTSSERTIPGNKYKHYSPRTPLHAVESLEGIDLSVNLAILAENKILDHLPKQYKSVNLGKDLAEIAQNLYHNLFILDQMQVEIGYIFLPVLDNSSLGLALKDRLDRVLAKN